MAKSFNPETVAETISERRKILEIIAVVITGLGTFIFMDILQWRLLYIVVAIVSWTLYILYCRQKNSQILKYWGFRRDNFNKVVLLVLPFGVISLIAFSAVGYSLDTINMTWHIIPILILYPLWGTVQQFLMISLITGNMKDLKGDKMKPRTIMLVTAILFAFVHYPNVWLVGGTFILALFYAYIYLKNRNVFVLGLFHGWLGAIFFYTVVGRDPFLEVFGKYLFF